VSRKTLLSELDIYIYIYMYVCVCVCACMRACVCDFYCLLNTITTRVESKLKAIILRCVVCVL
jgi:hypothetical protein